MDTEHESLREFRRALRRLESEIGLNFADETDCCGVTVAQCHLILELENAGDVSLGELSGRLLTDKSALSRTVDALVRDGLANREENPENRRKVTISLTPAGAGRADEINRRCDESYERVLAFIPEGKRAGVREGILLLAGAMRRARDEGVASCCAKR